MSWTLDKSANVWKCTKYSDLDIVDINNFAEYGQPYGPYDGDGKFEHDYVPDFGNVVIEMTQQEVMTHGYGKNLLAESFPITDRFLNEKLPFAFGTYSFDDLVQAGVASPQDRKIKGKLYAGGSNGFCSGDLETASAAYVHGTVSAALMAGTKFFYSAKQRQVTAEIGAFDDNWDFESSTIPDFIQVIVNGAIGPGHYNLTKAITIQFRGPGRKSYAEKITDEPEPDAGVPDEPPPPNKGISAEHPKVELLPIKAAPSHGGKGKNTIRMEVIPVACWKLNDVCFDFQSSFVTPETQENFADLLRLHKLHPGAPLSVFGHADPVGDDDFNKTLSGDRADAVYGVLTRDTQRWERLYTSGGRNEGWGPGSIQRMLEALGFIDTPVKKAIEKFQSANELLVDGIAGPKTRAKLFVAYMKFLCPEEIPKSEFLSKGADPGGKGDVQGCGEFNPVMIFSQAELKEFEQSGDKATRDVANEVNRRVLILLFRPGTSVRPERWPCPRTSEGVAACHKRFWSDASKRRSSQEEHREFANSQDTFGCRFYHRLVGPSPCEGFAERIPILLRLVWPCHLLNLLPDSFTLCLSGQGVPRQERSKSDAVMDEETGAFEFQWDDKSRPVQLEASGNGLKVLLWRAQPIGNLVENVDWHERLHPLLNDCEDLELEGEPTEAGAIPDDLGWQDYIRLLEGDA